MDTVTCTQTDRQTDYAQQQSHEIGVCLSDCVQVLQPGLAWPGLAVDCNAVEQPLLSRLWYTSTYHPSR